MPWCDIQSTRSLPSSLVDPFLVALRVPVRCYQRGDRDVIGTYGWMAVVRSGWVGGGLKWQLPCQAVQDPSVLSLSLHKRKSWGVNSDGLVGCVLLMCITRCLGLSSSDTGSDRPPHVLCHAPPLYPLSFECPEINVGQVVMTENESCLWKTSSWCDQVLGLLPELYKGEDFLCLNHRRCWTKEVKLIWHNDSWKFTPSFSVVTEDLD